MRIKGAPLDPTRSSRVTALPWFAVEGMGALELVGDEEDEGLSGEIKVEGESTSLGRFKIRIQEGQ
jgi:mannosyl-oligosaccharide glucosidase